MSDAYELNRLADDFEAYLRRPRYLNRQCEPITAEEFCTLHADSEYQCLAVKRIGNVVVSTIWAGIDLGMTFYPDMPALIFESAAFDLSPGEEDLGPGELLRELYHSEAAALKGHDAMVALVEARQA